MGIEKKLKSWTIKKNKKTLDTSFVTYVYKKTEKILKKFIKDNKIRENYSIANSELITNAVKAHLEKGIKEFPVVEINEYKDNIEIIVLNYGKLPSSLEEIYEKEKRENETNIERSSGRGIFTIKELIENDFKLNNIERNSKSFVEAKLYYKKKNEN